MNDVEERENRLLKLATTAKMTKKVMTKEVINPRVITMEYAVRGPIVIRAVELEKELTSVHFVCWWLEMSEYFIVGRAETV